MTNFEKFYFLRVKVKLYRNEITQSLYGLCTELNWIILLINVICGVILRIYELNSDYANLSSLMKLLKFLFQVSIADFGFYLQCSTSSSSPQNLKNLADKFDNSPTFLIS